MKTLYYSIIGISSLFVFLFVALAPVLDNLEAHYQVCDKNGCKDVIQYDSILYRYYCVGGIYATSGQFWLGQCVWNSVSKN
ncbi:MAG: hypothetical protein PXX83_09375 [Candidatus Nitrosotalea sp.]|nr:hypothetical protein [Candidatus Nitrosotalea sp.]